MKTSDTTSEILVLPEMKYIKDRVIDAAARGYASIIYGARGSGLTTLCGYIERECGHQLRCFYHVAARETSVQMSLQDLCEDLMGEQTPKGWRLHVAGQLSKVIARNLCNSNIRLLLFDHCENLNDEFRDAVFQIQARCRKMGHTLGTLFTVIEARQPELNFRNFVPYVYFSTHRGSLTPADTLTVLAEWCSGLDSLVTKYDANEAEAVKIADYICRHTGGNMAFIRQFAERLNSAYAKRSMSIQLVDTVVHDLTRPDFGIRR